LIISTATKLAVVGAGSRAVHIVGVTPITPTFSNGQLAVLSEPTKLQSSGLEMPVTSVPNANHRIPFNQAPCKTIFKSSLRKLRIPRLLLPQFKGLGIKAKIRGYQFFKAGKAVLGPLAVASTKFQQRGMGIPIRLRYGISTLPMYKRPTYLNAHPRAALRTLCLA
jgi:hypothetical protein